MNTQLISGISSARNHTIQLFNVNRVNSWGDLLVKLRETAIARGIDVDRIVGLGPFRDQQGELIPPRLQVNMLDMSETFAPHSAERLDLRLPEDKAGPDGFYPTNDLVRVDADGYLYFIAWRGDMIKTKAANVSRLEVEAALRALPK